MKFDIYSINSNHLFQIFNNSIKDYHINDDIDNIIEIPKGNFISQILYKKNWIDTVQWHLEDEIRDPQIDPKFGMELKRRIDNSNQERTNIVEEIDNFILENVNPLLNPDAELNTETPAWVIDRMSILALKIYHVELELNRNEINDKIKNSLKNKYDILLQQKKDLSISFDKLIQDIVSGKKNMKLYRQMKLYNDENTNPILYNKNNN